MGRVTEPVHNRCLLNAHISSHEQSVQQLPAVGSCVLLAGGPERTFVQLLALVVFYTKTASWKVTLSPFMQQLLQKIYLKLKRTEGR